MLSCSLTHRSFINRSLSNRPLAAALGLAALGLAPVHPAFAQTAVLTQNNDNARTGSNTAETVLTPQNVKTATFGKLFTMTGLNANVNGQVLYVPGVTIGGTKHNVVYAYTSNNSDNSPCGVYAYDGDTGTQLWKTILPNSATYTTATPVIDPATNTMYVLTKGPTDDTGTTYLHAFDITTGADKPGSPIQVQASAPGTGDGNVNGVVSFDGPAGGGNRFHANDRPGLLFANGMVYTAFAHNSDSFPYHGWVLAYKYDGTKFNQAAVFCTTPNGSDGGIWQAGKGLTADAAGNIYFSIGNGTFDANTGGADYGMCYLKLGPMLNVLDYFSPYDELTNSNQDLDLGNAGVTGIPGTTALFGGGTKFGSAFLMDSGNLGKFTPNGPDKVLARVDGVSGDDQVGQNPISWNSGSYKYVYLWPSGQTLEQFRYDPSVSNLNPKGIFAAATGSATNGGSLAVSSSGTASAILWAVGDEGTVRAYDATNIANAELWDSAQNASRDGIGQTGHFQFPTVVNGKVYVPTGGSAIAVYGLLQAPPPAATAVQINAGGGASGTFAADTDFTGGSAYATNAAISTSGVTSPAPQAIYQSERYGSFTYTMPNLTPGTWYTMRLHFAEIYWTAAGQRVFNVTVNGNPVLSNFDIFATAGGQNKAVVESFPVQADSTGKVTAVFTTVKDNAKLSGLEIISAPAAQTTVAQINAGGGASGTFAADTDVSGGSTYAASAAVSTQGVTSPAPQAIYQSERYGNFTYTVPNLTPGASYTLRLHFAEIYWNSANQRLFNVAVNGTQVLTNFDIFATAGGENKAIVETMPVTADSAGKVTVSFATVKDNAKLSGLELLH